MNEQTSAWMGAVDGLNLVHSRLRRVAILNRPAVEVITSQDSENTLFYLDPPYVHDTRTTTKEYGEYEMSRNQHEELIDTVLSAKGRFIISMYHHPIYDALVDDRKWRLAEFDLPNNSAAGASKRRMVECIYISF
jgi:DNA adenine methylase